MLKVYISADLEGINGVTYPHQVEPSGEGYKYAREQQHKELNCIIEALLNSGVNQITLNDAHGCMDNLLLSELNPKVELITGKPKPVSMMAGLDDSYSFVIFSGYHARAGSKAGVLAHTFSHIYKSIKLNDTLVGEIELNGIFASIKKVPVALVTGDNNTCEQARAFFKEINTVCVKKAISTTAAVCKPEYEVLQELSKEASLCVQKKFKKDFIIPNSPYKLEVEFVDRKKADVAELLPFINRISETSVVYESENYEAVYKLLQFLTATL